jgi:hypothetical protein
MKKNIRTDNLSKLRFLLPDQFPTQAWYSHGRKLFKTSEYLIDLAIPDVNTTKDIIIWFYEADANTNLVSHDDLSVNQQKRLINKLKLTLNQLEEDTNNLVRNKQNEAKEGIKKFIEIPELSNIYGLYNSNEELIRIILTNWATVYDVLNPNFGIIQRLKMENVLITKIRLIDKQGELKPHLPVNISFVNLAKTMYSNSDGFIEIDEIDKGTVLKIWQVISDKICNQREYLIQQDDTIDYMVVSTVKIGFTVKDKTGELKSNKIFVITYNGNSFEVSTDDYGHFELAEIVSGEKMNIALKQ